MLREKIMKADPHFFLGMLSSLGKKNSRQAVRDRKKAINLTGKKLRNTDEAFVQTRG